MQRGFLLERNSTLTGVQKNKLTGDNTKQGSHLSTPPGDSSITEEMGFPIPPNMRKRQATSPAKETSKLAASASAANQQIRELHRRSAMNTLSDWEEEGIVEYILVKIGYLDQFAPELTSSLRKWHVENL
ncbi:hypothetical protein GGF48_002267 [Coemansia sp. RSA 921]|nr:hypothetical protein GGF48_002267 [Coemansia sp. RSA 921]